MSGAIIHNGITLTVLDGFNNPGYSGGPVYADIGDGTPIFIGVISGYRNGLREKSLVYRPDGDGDGDGESEVDKLFVKPNSGMILAVQSAAVLDTFHSLHTSNAEQNLPQATWLKKRLDPEVDAGGLFLASQFRPLVHISSKRTAERCYHPCRAGSSKMDQETGISGQLRSGGMPRMR